MSSVRTWPVVTTEAVPWVPAGDPDAMSRSARQRHRGPYEASVVPSITGRALVLPPDVAALVADASAAVARFDAEIGTELAPFASVLLRTESASSSRIENLTAGARAIALAELGERSSRNAVEIAANVAAMTAAVDLADRLDETAVLAMHAALLGPSDPDAAGRWREQQVWVGGSAYGPHGATFVPPRHQRVPALMADLLAFCRREDLPVLALAAVAHAQFETVHPFTDGNGRTGRALVHALLRGHGLTRAVTVPVSAGLLADTGAYFDTLTAYRAGDPVPIVTAVAEAVFRAMANGRRLVSDLTAVRAGWEQLVPVRRGATAWRLADLLLRQPVVDAPTVADRLGIAPANALRPIAPLVDAGVLTEMTGAGRNRRWQAPEVLAALDAFAERAGRRG